MGETNIVAENKKFLEDHGVVLSAFGNSTGARSQHVCLREGEFASRPSHTRTYCCATLFSFSSFAIVYFQVILVKNLSPEATVDTLRPLFEPHGAITRFVLPPSRTMALVEFAEPTEARRVLFLVQSLKMMRSQPILPPLGLINRTAFKKLAYRRFKGEPLYLEWAPAGCFQPLSQVAPSVATKEEPAPKAPTAKRNASTRGAEEPMPAGPAAKEKRTGNVQDKGKETGPAEPLPATAAAAVVRPGAFPL